MRCPGVEEKCGELADIYPSLRISRGLEDGPDRVDLILAQPYCRSCCKPRPRVHEWDEDEEDEEEFLERVANIPEGVTYHHLLEQNPRLWRQVELFFAQKGWGQPQKTRVNLRWIRNGETYYP